MARLPTVKIENRRTGEIKIINQTDYARDIASYFDWKILALKHGNATDNEVITAALESDVNKFRLENDAEQRKRGDQDRRMEHNRIVINSAPGETTEFVSAEEPEPPVAEVALAETQPAAPVVTPEALLAAPEPVDFATAPWRKIRDYVQTVTGKRPRDKEDAAAILAAHNGDASKA